MPTSGVQVLDFRTKFRRKALKLKGPTNAGFEPAEWQAIFNKESELPSDKRLLDAALWIAEQHGALRKNLPPSALERIARCHSVCLCVASLNREGSVINANSRTAANNAADEGIKALHSILSTPIAGGYKNQKRTPADWIETAIDAAESWLYDAGRAPECGEDISEDIALTIRSAMEVYSLHHTLHDMWQQALWEGWGLTTDTNGNRTWGPSDRTLANLFSAWMTRDQENFMNYPWIDFMTWPLMSRDKRRRLSLPKTVTRVQPASGKSGIKIGHPTNREPIPPSYRIDVSGLEGTYVAQFMSVPFPKQPELDIALILKAWGVIRDLANALEARLAEPETWTREDVNRWSLSVDRAELVSAIQSALGISADVTGTIIEFLSFTPGKTYKGLWAAPLVPIPETTQIGLVRPVLTLSSAIRRAEIWMQKGGLDDSLATGARGDEFEAAYRSLLQSAVANNSMLDETRVAKHEVKKNAEFDEQIDLLLKLGSTLVVGEIKCFLSPADPRERFNYLENLIEAAEQANRKAAAISKRPDVAAKALGITEAEATRLNVVPAVVMNQGAGFSLEISGCVVIDGGFLRTYLSGPELNVGAAIQPGTGRATQSHMRLYESQAEAEDRFLPTMKDPWVLKRFVDRVAWDAAPFPTRAGSDLIAEYPYLMDIAGSERSTAEQMEALLKAT